MQIIIYLHDINIFEFYSDCEKYSSSYETECVNDEPKVGKAKPVMLREYPHYVRLELL